jgi:Protein of unknown function (DUF3551)
MRLLLLILGIGVGVVGIGNRAEAQNYPWCAIYSSLGGENCGFTTFEQCMRRVDGYRIFLGRVPICDVLPLFRVISFKWKQTSAGSLLA